MTDRQPSLAVVYLLWGPLGPKPVREFLASYTKHPAGVRHELVVLLNGVDPAQRATLLAPLEGVAHSLLELEAPVQDLAAYGQAAARLPHDLLCCMNTYSIVLANDWLRILVDAALTPGVGLAGATGSWESQAQWPRGEPRGWFAQLSALRTLRRDFPGFPNPHLRTTAFVLRRSLLLEMGLESARDKYSAYLLESGRRSVTRTVIKRGLRVVVAGRNGQLYDSPQWPNSSTYRRGGQTNLLVADRRTGDWERADTSLRQRLGKDAWGRSVSPDQGEQR
jgi:hypothetical protein